MKFLSSIKESRFPVLGMVATCALLVLFFYVPELTTIWLSSLLVSLICAFFLSRFPVRRIAPGDLRNAQLLKGKTGADRALVDPRFALQFIRPVPELLIIGGVALVIARLGSFRVHSVFAEEVGSNSLLAEFLGVTCALLASGRMLRSRTNEFVLRARQLRSWGLMLRTRGILVCCIWFCQFPFGSIPGVTQRVPKVAYVPEYTPRSKATFKHVSPSGKVSVEIWSNNEGSNQEVWVRDRNNLKDRVMVGSYAPGVTALVSPDDVWLAVDYVKHGVREVDLYQRAGSNESATIQYLPTGRDNFALSMKARSLYASENSSVHHYDRKRASVIAKGWSKDTGYLTLAVIATDLNQKLSDEPWLCVFVPERRLIEAVTIKNTAAQASEGASQNEPQKGSEVQRHSFPGERYPETRTRLLSEKDFAGWPPEKLRYAINEMFARHGADFSKPDLNKWFAQFNWATFRAGVSLETIEQEEFSAIERHNLDVLGAVRALQKGQP